MDYMEYYAITESMQFFFLIAIVITGVVFLADYLLNAIAYYKLAKARNMPNAWVAWIPVANDYMVGRVSDSINADYRKTTHRGVGLLILGIITTIASVVVLITGFFLMNQLMDFAFIYGEGDVPYTAIESLFSLLIPMAIAILALAITAIWYTVLRFMSYYTVFKEYAAQSAGVYLAVSLIAYFIASITFIPAIFVLVSYKKVPQFQTLNAARSYGDPYPNQPGAAGQGYPYQYGTPQQPYNNPTQQGGGYEYNSPNTQAPPQSGPQAPAEDQSNSDTTNGNGPQE